MDYWTNTMQDDIYMLVLDGWVANSDLIPANFIVERYFKSEQEAIDQLESERDSLIVQKEELEEEQSGEEGILEELKSDKGNISKGIIKKRIKEIKDDPDFSDELFILNAYLNLLERESDVEKNIRVSQKKLDANVNAKYPLLSENEIKSLAVENKWLKKLREEIINEVGKISQNITQRVIELAERYADPLPKIEKDAEILGKKVKEHLKQMGFEWK